MFHVVGPEYALGDFRRQIGGGVIGKIAGHHIVSGFTGGQGVCLVINQQGLVHRFGYQRFQLL